MGVSIEAWRASIGTFIQGDIGSRTLVKGPRSEPGSKMSTILLCVRVGLLVAMLLQIGGVETNPGPVAPQTPGNRHLDTPKCRSTDPPPTPRNVNINIDSACMQCHKNVAGDETRAIRCGECGLKMHLACLKYAHYIEGPGWRSQDPPQYLSQLFNTPSFRFTCHMCIDKTPGDNTQHDYIANGRFYSPYYRTQT